jgi:glycosyltransferase involved in cell wall biosynthesis
VLFASETAARVEISVDGRWVGRARPAVARPDLARVSWLPAAGLSGFEYELEPGDLPPEAEQVTLGACALGTHGGVAWLTKEAVPVRRRAPTAPTVDIVIDVADDLAVLRQRVQDVIASAPPARTYPLRLLAFTHELGYGGAQLFLAEVLRLLRANLGAECVIVSFVDGPLRQLLESLGIVVQIIHADRGQDPILYEGKMLELAAWAAPQGFNAVVVNTVYPFMGVDLAQRLNVPAVWLVHESFDLAAWWGMEYEGTRSYTWERMRLGMRSAAAVVIPAERTRQLYLPYASPERLIVAPHGIMLDEIDRYRAGFDRRRLRRELEIAEGATVVLCLGTIEPRKGQAALALAFDELAEAFPDAVLALVGETDQEWQAPRNQELHRFICRAQLESRVAMVPLTADPYQWLAIADVFVLASDLESLPRVVLEAMAFELPVIATSIFGVADLIEDGRTGYLCQARDVGDLRRTLESVLASDPDERRRVARAGAEHVRRHHDGRKYALRFGDLLQALVADPRALPGSTLTPV